MPDGGNPFFIISETNQPLCLVRVENTDLLLVGREYRLAVFAYRVEDTVLLFRVCLQYHKLLQNGVIAVILNLAIYYQLNCFFNYFERCDKPFPWWNSSIATRQLLNFSGPNLSNAKRKVAWVQTKVLSDESTKLPNAVTLLLLPPGSEWSCSWMTSEPFMCTGITEVPWAWHTVKTDAG